MRKSEMDPDKLLLRELRRLARQHGWKVAGWRFAGTLQVLRRNPYFSDADKLRETLEQLAVIGFFTHETKPRLEPEP